MENVIGKRIKQLREEKGWTKTFTAEKLGIKTMSTYANWEYGTRTPDGEMMTKIADLFDVSTDFLLGRTDIRNPEKQPEGRFFYDLDNASQEDLEDLEEMFKILQRRKQKRENKDSK